MSVIYGRVTDESQSPIYDAKVSVIEGTGSYPEIIALTDTNGEYDLEYISEGIFTVAVEKEGYMTKKKEIFVKKDSKARLDFILIVM